MWTIIGIIVLIVVIVSIVIIRKRNKINKQKGDPANQNVKIRIFRSMGSDVKTLVGDFDALEKRDSFGGMVIENAKYNFLEDVDFNKEDFFEEFKMLLQIREATKEQSLEKIKEKIDKQKKKISYLNKFIELNAIFNYPDEELNLRLLNVLYNNIKNVDSDRGAFFTFEGNKRVYTFMKENGQYHPIWHGADGYTTYPDYTTKHKIANFETEIFKSEWSIFLRNNVQPAALAVMTIVLALMICVAGWGIFELYEKSEALDRTAQKSSLECVNQYNQLNTQIFKLLTNEVTGGLINQSMKNNEEKGKNDYDQIKKVKNLIIS